MELIKNIKKVSFFFFAGLGALHIFAGLMTVNGFAVNLMTGINRILDIPFLASALLFGLTSIRLKLPINKNINLAFILFGLLIILVVLYINLVYPDLNRFSSI